jgi:SAM-dependent methyltransferase
MSKRVQDAFLEPGDLALYPGIGRGEEALRAARAGVRVLGLDVSESMLGATRARFAAEGLEGDFRIEDVAVHRPDRLYDAIVAHYFLNLFEAARARAMLERFASWLRPGGRLVLADFARPSKGLLGRLLCEAYYRPVNAIAWALGLCAWHPILDYRELLAGLPFRILAEERFPVGCSADPAYVSIVAEKVVSARTSDQSGGDSNSTRSLSTR